MKKTFFRVVALTAALSLTTMNMAFAGGSIGHGNISVYKDNTLVSKLSGQNPIEDGALLVCDGKCMLKSEGISVIAADKSKIAVKNETDTFRLYVKEGIVDYVINSNARKIAFYTPQGTYTVAEVVFNASSTPVVKGRVVVDSEGNTEISVNEGRMVFATSEGMKTVDANHKIVLAQGQFLASNYGVIYGVILATAWTAASAATWNSRNTVPNFDLPLVDSTNQ
jgi:hypothetical protein